MPDVNLETLVKEWLDNRWGLRLEQARITGACECGQRARYAIVYSDGVTLANAICECIDCKRVEIAAGNPQFFELLQKAFEARVAHRSVIISNHLQDGDDIQHAIDHFKGRKPIYLEGNFEDQKVDVRDTKLVIEGGTIKNCSFSNINTPIEAKANSNVTITGCGFYMGTTSPYWINYPFDII